MRWVGPVSLLVALAACAAPPSKLAEYGAAKQSLCRECRRDTLNLALPAEYVPQRGVVLAYGRRAWPYTEWTVIDLDRRTMAVVETEAASRGPARADQEDDTAVTAEELDAVVDGANRVWARPPAAPAPAAAGGGGDRQWGLYLFDGRAIFRDAGAGAVPDYARALEQAVDGIRARRPIALPD